MYLALARKYRPQDFTQVIGQDAVMKTLQNAITLARIHHAYLFCGARGVGKTSLARILAKSINCEKGPAVTPCQVCASCVAITKSAALDVIEIDAASNTGVDNIRELREQVKYLPTNGKYKIYIIDEVHMLSNSAFNALLKTLEEPPAHVLFILATTEPHEIPITILSRCQRFDFRKINKPVLVAHLQKILDSEGVKAEAGAVELVADCAQGSVRDALSLLDQVIGYHGQDIKESQVRAALGLSERLLIQETFRDLVTEDISKSLKNLSAADEQGLDLKNFAEDLVRCYRNLILVLATKEAPPEISPSEAEFYQGLAGQTELSLALAQYQVLFQGLSEVSRTEFQKTSLEITFVKISEVREMISLADLVTELKERAEKKGVARPVNAAISPQNLGARQESEVKPVAVLTGTVKDAAPAPSENARAVAAPASDWYELVRWVKKIKPQLGGPLGDAVPLSYSDQGIVIGFEAASTSRNLVIERKPLLDEMLTKHFGKKVPFTISELEGEKKKP